MSSESGMIHTFTYILARTVSNIAVLGLMFHFLSKNRQPTKLVVRGLSNHKASSPHFTLHTQKERSWSKLVAGSCLRSLRRKISWAADQIIARLSRDPECLSLSLPLPPPPTHTHAHKISVIYTLIFFSGLQLGIRIGLYIQDFWQKCCVSFASLPFVVHFILMLSQKYNLSNFPLCNFSHYPVVITSLLLKQLSTFYLQTESALTEYAYSSQTWNRKYASISNEYCFSNTAKIFTERNFISANLLTFRLNARGHCNAKCPLTFLAGMSLLILPTCIAVTVMATFYFHIKTKQWILYGTNSAP